MLQTISNEQLIITSVEGFLKQADGFINRYYAGELDDEAFTELKGLIQNLAANCDLETEYRDVRDRKDLETDYLDSSWF